MFLLKTVVRVSPDLCLLRELQGHCSNIIKASRKLAKLGALGAALPCCPQLTWGRGSLTSDQQRRLPENPYQLHESLWITSTEWPKDNITGTHTFRAPYPEFVCQHCIRKTLKHGKAERIEQQTPTDLPPWFTIIHISLCILLQMCHLHLPILFFEAFQRTKQTSMHTVPKHCSMNSIN